MTHLQSVENMGPTFHTTVGRLYAVQDRGRHVILKTRRPTEEWVFEVEVAPGHWELCSIYFPKWNHPQSARAKFLKVWLSEDYDASVLSAPEKLVGQAAELVVRVSFDSNNVMTRTIISAKPTSKPVKSPGSNK